MQLAFMITRWSGIRRTELVARSIRQHYDLSRREFRIVGKNNMERICPLHKNLLTYLKGNPIFNSREPDQKLFTIKPRSFSQAIGHAKTNAGLSHIRGRSHLLRHSLGYYLINQGKNIRLVQKILGHETLLMTTIYTQMLRIVHF